MVEDEINSPREGQIRAELRTFFFVNKAAFFVALALTGVTLAICCLALAAAWDLSCGGHDSREGHRPIDCLGLVLGNAWVAFMFSRLWQTEKNEKRMSDTFEANDVPVFAFGTREVTYGEALVYGVMLSLLAMSGLMVGISITHYYEVLAMCRAPA